MSHNELENKQIAANEADYEIDILELFYCLAEKFKYIVIAAVIGALILGVYSFAIASPQYEATCVLYVLTSSNSAINLSDFQIGSYLASDYKQVFDMWEVQEMVLQNLNLAYSYKQLSNMLDVTNPSNTRMLNITVKSPDPNEAAIIANEFANVAKRYIAETMETDEPSIASKALVPQNPVSPRKVRNTVIGFILGAFLMSLFFIIQFILDDKIKTSDDIRKYANMSTFAVIPVNTGVVLRSKSKNQPDRKRDTI